MSSSFSSASPELVRKDEDSSGWPELSQRQVEVAVRSYDVFICHASEDNDFVRPLADALREHGLKVWYDGYTLRIGSALRRTIDDGLAHSKFGIVVLSPAFFAKAWPQRELDGLVGREILEGQQLILPIWHKISQADVSRFSPPLIDKLARSTSTVSIEEIASEVAEVVRSRGTSDAR